MLFSGTRIPSERSLSKNWMSKQKVSKMKLYESRAVYFKIIYLIILKLIYNIFLRTEFLPCNKFSTDFERSGRCWSPNIQQTRILPNFHFYWSQCPDSITWSDLQSLRWRKFRKLLFRQNVRIKRLLIEKNISIWNLFKIT